MVFEKNIVEFLNLLSYAKDKAEMIRRENDKIMNKGRTKHYG